MPPPLPALGPREAKEMDRVAEEDYHVPLAIMMENAGRTFASLTRRLTPGTGPRRAAVLVGKGGNGGGALATARHLLNAGWTVDVVMAVPPQTLLPGAWLHHEMARESGARLVDAPGDTDVYAGADVILDGLLGYNARGEPRPPMDETIRRANAAGALRIALDIPTGIDPESGERHGVAFRAGATLMLALPKRGVLLGEGPAHAGELWLGDIGFPEPAYRKLGAARPPFDEAGIHRFEGAAAAK